MLSLAPLLPLAAPAGADAPAVAVTGLARGARGDAVKSVQQALVNQGVQVAGGVDGIFGHGTESALKSFQSQQGLAAIGRRGRCDRPRARSDVELAPRSRPRGRSGDAVTSLQQRARSRPASPSSAVPTGSSGRAPTRAVQDFQAQQGFSTTGVVNAATAAALERCRVRTPPGGAARRATCSRPTTKRLRPPCRPRSDGRSEDRRPQRSGEDTPADADVRRLHGGRRRRRHLRRLDGQCVEVVPERERHRNRPASSTTRPRKRSPRSARAPRIRRPPTSRTRRIPSSGLQYGSIGADVKALQNALHRAPGVKVRGGADGVFGARDADGTSSSSRRTRASDRAGKVDAATAEALSSGATVTGGSTLVGLKAGALGNTVKSLQQALIDAGIKVRGGADGIFGPATANAVKEFQTLAGTRARPASSTRRPPERSRNPEAAGRRRGSRCHRRIRRLRREGRPRDRTAVGAGQGRHHRAWRRRR